MMKLMEECAGVVELVQGDSTIRPIAYRVRRYQGISECSGMPISGLFRIEGSVDLESGSDIKNWIGASLGLKLEDGRVLGIAIVDRTGRILSEGHGPSKCLCC